jgi:hypothetical protein
MTKQLLALLHNNIEHYLLQIFNRTNERAVERYVRNGVTTECEQEQQESQGQCLEHVAYLIL